MNLRTVRADGKLSGPDIGKQKPDIWGWVVCGGGVAEMVIIIKIVRNLCNT